jgi:hypothetical protein
MLLGLRAPRLGLQLGLPWARHGVSLSRRRCMAEGARCMRSCACVQRQRRGHAAPRGRARQTPLAPTAQACGPSAARVGSGVLTGTQALWLLLLGVSRLPSHRSVALCH